MDNSFIINILDNAIVITALAAVAIIVITVLVYIANYFYAKFFKKTKIEEPEPELEPELEPERVFVFDKNKWDVHIMNLRHWVVDNSLGFVVILGLDDPVKFVCGIQDLTDLSTEPPYPFCITETLHASLKGEIARVELVNLDAVGHYELPKTADNKYSHNNS